MHLVSLFFLLITLFFIGFFGRFLGKMISFILSIIGILISWFSCNYDFIFCFILFFCLITFLFNICFYLFFLWIFLKNKIKKIKIFLFYFIFISIFLNMLYLINNKEELNEKLMLFNFFLVFLKIFFFYYFLELSKNIFHFFIFWQYNEFLAFVAKISFISIYYLYFFYKYSIDASTILNIFYLKDDGYVKNYSRNIYSLSNLINIDTRTASTKQVLYPNFLYNQHFLNSNVKKNVNFFIYTNTFQYTNNFQYLYRWDFFLVNKNKILQEQIHIIDSYYAINLWRFKTSIYENDNILFNNHFFRRSLHFQNFCLNFYNLQPHEVGLKRILNKQLKLGQNQTTDIFNPTYVERRKSELEIRGLNRTVSINQMEVGHFRTLVNTNFYKYPNETLFKRIWFDSNKQRYYCFNSQVLTEGYLYKNCRLINGKIESIDNEKIVDVG